MMQIHPVGKSFLRAKIDTFHFYIGMIYQLVSSDGDIKPFVQQTWSKDLHMTNV